MKAICLILLGVIVAALSGHHFLDARAVSATGQASLWFVGIVAGLVITLWGLAMNHRDHTSR